MSDGVVSGGQKAPHYSLKSNRKSSIPHSDARSDGTLAAALDAVREVASKDPDHARLANAEGFSVSDFSLGHRLAKLSVSQLKTDPVARGQVLALASRYRRQVSPRLRFQLGLTDQRDLFG